MEGVKNNNNNNAVNANNSASNNTASNNNNASNANANVTANNNKKNNKKNNNAENAGNAGNAGNNKPAKKEKKENNTSASASTGEKRTFKLADPLIVYKELHGKAVKSKDPRGKYSDLTPGGAARKMFRRIARSRQLEKFVSEGKVNANGKINKTVSVAEVVGDADKNIVFSMIEVDKDGNEIKRFYYKGSNKLDEPITNKFIGFNLKTGKRKTSVQYILPSISAISKEEYDNKIKNQ